MEDAMKFQLGQLVATPDALEALEAAKIDPLSLIDRHLAGDWGNVPPEDAALNEAALKNGSRLLSSYPLPSGKVWVITEADRSVTTILLPSEY
jgi:hypothetical protein